MESVRSEVRPRGRSISGNRPKMRRGDSSRLSCGVMQLSKVLPDAQHHRRAVQLAWVIGFELRNVQKKIAFVPWSQHEAGSHADVIMELHR